MCIIILATKMCVWCNLGVSRNWSTVAIKRIFESMKRIYCDALWYDKNNKYDHGKAIILRCRFEVIILDLLKICCKAMTKWKLLDTEIITHIVSLYLLSTEARPLRDHWAITKLDRSLNGFSMSTQRSQRSSMISMIFQQRYGCHGLHWIFEVVQN